MKVGLKETLSLLAAGYKKKDIDALAAIDEENEKVSEIKEEKTEHISETKEETEDPKHEKQENEPDYKKMYEELLEQNKKTEAKVTKLQQDNIHKDSAPASAEARQKEQKALTDLVRGFM